MVEVAAKMKRQASGNGNNGGSGGEDETPGNGGGNQAVGECPEVDVVMEIMVEVAAKMKRQAMVEEIKQLVNVLRLMANISYRLSIWLVTLLPHGSDCTKFYICNEGTPVVTDCPSGLLFNPTLLVCDYPESAGCGTGSSGNGNNGGGSGLEEETPDNGGGNQAVGECPEVDGEYVTLLPHGSDCTKFYICNEGTPVVAECPAGLLFNPNLFVCDYPESAGCEPGSSGNGNNGGSGGEDETPGNGGGNQAVGECPEEDGEYVSLLPHGSDLKRQAMVEETRRLVNVPRRMANMYLYSRMDPIAPNFTFFNPTLLVCDYPESAGCEPGNGNNGENGGEDETPSESEEETPGNGEGNQAVGECPENETGFLLPHASDCSKFYICIGGEPIVQSCPAGLLFNPQLMVCDWPQYVQCK
ncbi:Chitin binding Peritrophin-A domain [Popillia japonica]|uniref:Chitin binding Peritrophin-A domain n=1 Tax=Popillia japonica TaxID=7064 RepID=A0AAW1IBT9_POPJA